MRVVDKLLSYLPSSENATLLLCRLHVATKVWYHYLAGVKCTTLNTQKWWIAALRGN
jgi:hypothetical protein